MKYNKKIHLKMTFFMQMEAFHNLFYKKIGVEILVKYRNLVESTFETQIFSRLSQHFCLIFFHPKKYYRIIFLITIAQSLNIVQQQKSPTIKIGLIIS
jgi:hypothetical protein